MKKIIIKNIKNTQENIKWEQNQQTKRRSKYNKTKSMMKQTKMKSKNRYNSVIN